MTENRILSRDNLNNQQKSRESKQSPISQFEIGQQSPFFKKAVTIAAKGWDMAPSSLQAVYSIAPTEESYPLYYRLDTQSGKYVLKTIRRYVRDEKLVLIQHVLSLLEANGIPVSLPIPTSTGLPSFSYGDERYSLSPYIEGKHFDGSADQLTQSARVLGQIHAVLSTNVELLPEEQVKFAQSESPRLPTASPDTLISRIQQTIPTGEFETTAHSLIHEIAAILPSIREDVASDEAAPLLIHADFHGENLLFPFDGSLPTVIDWDNLAWSKPMQDLSFASHRLGRVSRGNWQSEMQQFLREYNSVYPLNQSSEEKISSYLLDEYLTRMLLILTYHYIDQRRDADSVLPDFIQLANEALTLRK